MKKIQTGIYRHYKGPRYLVIGLARHSETEEAMVVYVPLERRNPKNRKERQRMCVRPLALFTPKFKLEIPIDFDTIVK